MPIDQVSTQYVNNSQYSNSVLNLMFLHANMKEFNNNTILLNLQSIFDHAPLLIYIIIKKKTI